MVFLEENNLSQDQCALLTKELQNQSVTDYYLFNMYTTSTCDTDKLMDFTLNNPNLRFKDGFGNVSGCTVETDSEIRNSAKMTNFREKEQLCTRWYQATPNYGKGGLLPNIESRLLFSENTSHLRDCGHLAERSFDFMPMMGCLKKEIQNPEHIIMPYAKSTRDYVYDDAYLERCGYVKKLSK